MGSLKKSRTLRLGFAVCCLAYVAWVVYLGLKKFDMVHSDYRRAGERLQPERIREIALQELVDQCRRESKRSDRLRSAADESFTAAEDPCLSWPENVLEERQKTVAKRLLGEKNRSGLKLVLFYVFFVVVFLVLPLGMMYGLLSFLIWLRRNLQFVK